MNKRFQIAKYVILDVLSASIAIYLFSDKIQSLNIAIVLFWLTLYTITLTYYRIYYKSRLKEIINTLIVCSFGLVIISCIAFIINMDYFDIKIIINYSLVHIGLTALFRFLITTRTANRIHNREIGFNTLIIGSDKKAYDLYSEIERQRKSSGNIFIGYLKTENEEDLLKDKLLKLGVAGDVQSILKNSNIDEVLIALNENEGQNVNKIIGSLEGSGAVIKIIPDMHDILTGSVKMGAIFGTPLIEIYPDILSPWQQIFKRIFDVSVSLIVLVLFSPFYLLIAVSIIINSNGGVIFKQIRVGKKGELFSIYKFRTMFLDAEKNGPQLSSLFDARITSIGKFLRKYRLDELPQFINVLKGEMSIVGPRPERQFFIDRIIEKAPHYYHLTKVRPGITSWGQVKYGYAETVEQMIDRLKFDIIYIENVSFLLDMKILFYTIATVLKGKGK